jgi:SOS-response transcriptional repressor LexA
VTHDESDLTEKQRAILAFIRQAGERGYGVTYRELMTAFGMSSTNAIACHIKPLVRKGYLAADPHKARSLRVVGQPTIAELMARVVELEGELQALKGVK